MQNEQTVESRIANAALELIASQGIKKTTMGEVAQEAGVTRVTVYRYFRDKERLIRAAFMQIAGVFQEIRDDLAREAERDAHSLFDHMESKLCTLPVGDFPARNIELKRLYPDVFEEIHQIRLTTLNEIFERLFDAAERQQLLRPGLNRKVIQLVFWEVIANLMENPKMANLGVPSHELHRSIRDVFLYGILKNE